MNAQPHLNTQYAWYDPRRYDLTISERIQNLLAPNTAFASDGNQGSNLFGAGARTPAAVNSVNNISGNPEREWSTVNNDGTRTITGTGETGYSLANTTPIRSDGTIIPDGGGAGGGGADPNGAVVNPGDGGFGELLRMARDEARRVAGERYNRARGIYDEGMGLLNKRRGEFQDIFNTGRENILGGYEKGRGELQASSQGADTRMANAMRALGLGGSAFVKAEGRQRQDQAKGLGQLNTEKSANEIANTGQFTQNQDWANTQEGALNRNLGDAAEARTSAETSSDIGYLQDMGNLFNTILSNQLAVNASTGAKTANPYTVNISDMTSALNGSVPNLMGGAGTVQNVKLQDQDPTLALLKKRSGVAGAGLYA